LGQRRRGVGSDGASEALVETLEVPTEEAE
jgi:hypothetical protein